LSRIPENRKLILMSKGEERNYWAVLHVPQWLSYSLAFGPGPQRPGLIDYQTSAKVTFVLYDGKENMPWAAL